MGPGFDTKNVYWETAAAGITRLNEKDARRIFNHVPDIQNAFVLRQRSLTCVDDGLIGGIHLPGSGVMMPIEQLRAEVAAAGIDELTTHDSCGAYMLWFPGDPEPNRGAREWGQKTAALLGLPHRHITAAEMDRPSHLHTAIAVYYDGTGQFNRIAGLPVGFVVSRKHFSTAQQDLALCLQIAFGDQGFGNLFTPQIPLYVIPLAHPCDPALSLKVLEGEVRDVIGPYGSRVKMSGVKTAGHMREQF